MSTFIALLWGYGAILSLVYMIDGIAGEKNVDIGEPADNVLQLMGVALYILLFWWYLIWQMKHDD